MVFDLGYSKDFVSDDKLEQAKKEAVNTLVNEYNQAQKKAVEEKARFKNFMNVNDDSLFDSFTADRYFNVNPEYIRELVGKRLFVMQDKEKIEGLANEHLALLVVHITKLYKTEFEKGLQLEFYQKLLKLKREELLAIYYVMDYQNYRQKMGAAVKGYKKHIRG